MLSSGDLHWTNSHLTYHMVPVWSLRWIFIFPRDEKLLLQKSQTYGRSFVWTPLSCNFIASRRLNFIAQWEHWYFFSPKQMLRCFLSSPCDEIGFTPKFHTLDQTSASYPVLINTYLVLCVKACLFYIYLRKKINSHGIPQKVLGTPLKALKLHKQT